jgi:hypothetical protein
MTQNRSSAVMQQRAEPHDSLDDFPTQPWGTRALMTHVIKELGLLRDGARAWEPTCNRGYMARPLMEYFGDEVYATDIFDYGWQRMNAREDFLFFGVRPPEPVDWVITNPPFRLAEEFIRKARDVARIGCAILVRTSFLEGVDRYRNIYSTCPPTVIAQFVERLPMVKGRCDPEASTATSYAWLVWVHGQAPQPFRWIPPCRRQLEKPGDYDG